MTEPNGTYSGYATINGFAADVAIVAQANTIHGISWSGSAFILDPTVDLLELTGVVELVVAGRTASAQVTDATPGSRYVYFRGHRSPPFELE